MTPWRNSYILKLPDKDVGYEPTKIRRNVAKAARLGLRVRTAESTADLGAWYHLYLQTMRRGLVPPRSRRFFAAMWDDLRPRGMMELLVAEVNEGGRGRLVAGCVLLKYGDTVSYAFGAMDRRLGFMCANDAIYWQAIRDACQCGFHYFDLGEVPEGHTDLARFKAKWGARPTPMFRYYSPGLPGSPESSNIQTRLLAEGLWRRIPLKLTEFLGGHIYRRL